MKEEIAEEYNREKMPCNVEIRFDLLAPDLQTYF